MSEGAGGILSRDAIIGLNSYWKIQKLDYTGGPLLYRGVNAKHGALDGDSTWGIWKYTYDGDDLTVIEGPLTWDWTDRANAGWV